MRESKKHRVVKQSLLITALALCGLYAGDDFSVRFRIPRSRNPFGVVNVQTSYAVKQKDGKVEYYFNPPETQTCVRSLFPHMGYAPCWYLARKSSRQISL